MYARFVIAGWVKVLIPAGLQRPLLRLPAAGAQYDTRVVNGKPIRTR
jgi:hypothetical protein